MGFEIIYKFRDLGEDGEYSSEIKEKKARVGKADQDIPLATVAGKIIAQLARRSILLVDVEIYEFTRKKVNYKQDEEFIKIKGRKFNFEDGAAVLEEGEKEEDAQEQLLRLLQENPDLISGLTKSEKSEIIPKAVASVEPAPLQPSTQSLDPKPQPKNLNAPIRWEVFDPDEDSPWNAASAVKNGWQFTRGKKYPVYEEKPAGANPMSGMAYVTTDDSGHQQQVSDKYFVTSVGPLIGEGEFMEDSVNYVGAATQEPVLSYDNTPEPNMPKLR